MNKMIYLVITMNYRLKKIRNDYDLLQVDVAHKINVNVNTYKGWENENDNIPLKKLNLFCNLFKVSLNYATKLIVRENRNIKIDLIDISPKIVGQNLEIIRKNMNLNQKQFAKLLDISPSSYRNYKNGKYFPQTLILKTFAQNYNVSLDWLLGKSKIKNYK